MKIILTALLCAMISGCNTWQPAEYSSEVMVMAEEKMENSKSTRLFNTQVTLKRKTADEIKIITLPPLIAARDLNGLAWVKTNIEGMNISYSIDVLEAKENYDLLHYKLDISDRMSYHEERIITVKKDDTMVKSGFLPNNDKLGDKP
jgi:hypothetical protein